MTDDPPIGPESLPLPSADLPTADGNGGITPPRERGLLAHLVLWTVVCCVSAGPSLVFAWNAYDRTGLLLSIYIFVGFYTLISASDLGRQIRREPVIRVPLTVAYGVRVAMSVLFPIGMVVDLVTGLGSVWVVGTFFDDDRGFFATLATGLVHAIFMHFILAVIFLFALPLGYRARRRERILASCCQQCNYDLRGSPSSIVCPECGTPIPRSLHVHLNRLLRNEKPASG